MLTKEARTTMIKELSERIDNMPDEDFLKKVKAYFIRQYYTMKDDALQQQYNNVIAKKD